MAREAEICYATVALSTDYDCWHESEEDVSVDAVIAVVNKNVATARDLVRRAATMIKGPRECICENAAQHALMTAELDEAAAKRLSLILGKYK